MLSRCAGVVLTFGAQETRELQNDSPAGLLISSASSIFLAQALRGLRTFFFQGTLRPFNAPAVSFSNSRMQKFKLFMQNPLLSTAGLEI